MSLQHDATFYPPYTHSTAEQDNIVFPDISQRQLAWLDIIDGLGKWHVWMMLAYQDIKLRYRRSVLGPFWLTISMAITVYSMGYLYSTLFKMDITSYFPFLVGGMLSWTLIATSYSDLVDSFTTAEGMMKQIKLPYTLYIHRIAFRNILIFFHNIFVIVPVIFIFHEGAKINLFSLLLIPGLFLLYINVSIYGLILAMLGARYRDISQIVKSLIQVIFFITPVMWKPSSLPPEKQFIVTYNPFHSLVEIIRAPLIGAPPEMSNYTTTILTTCLGMLACWVMFVKYRSRIVYWI